MHRAATLLREQFDATQVAAFGSLVHGYWFSRTSDLDLAVWGLQADDYFVAVAKLQDLSPVVSYPLPLAGEIATSTILLAMVAAAGRQVLSRQPGPKPSSLSGGRRQARRREQAALGCRLAQHRLFQAGAPSDPVRQPSGGSVPISATTVNYRGRLADNGGNPLDGTNGTSSCYGALPPTATWCEDRRATLAYR